MSLTRPISAEFDGGSQPMEMTRVVSPAQTQYGSQPMDMTRALPSRQAPHSQPFADGEGTTPPPRRLPRQTMDMDLTDG